MARALLAAVVVLAAGCGVSVPADPDGTLDRVRGSTVRVGVSPNPPYTEVASPGADPAGSEVELVRAFADHLDAEVAFTVAGEQSLVARMEAGELDLLVGGLTDRTPWQKQVAVTRPYQETPAPGGGTDRHVMAVPMGENAWLVELERFLHERTGR